MNDRITRLRISGLRAIRDVTVDLSGLTVLIGDNGTGKSSIIEALELLRQAATPLSYIHDVLVNAHGPFDSLLRRGSPHLGLGVTIEGGGPRIDYDFTIGHVGNIPRLLTERVDIHHASGAEPLHALTRKGTKTSALRTNGEQPVPVTLVEEVGDPRSEWQELPIGDQVLALPSLGMGILAQPAFERVLQALRGIELHVPFRTRPLWQQRELDDREGPRWPALLDQSDAVARYAHNLPNAYQRLRNVGGEVWSRVIERARLGLGDDLRDFRLPPSGRGHIELEVVFGRAPDKPFPAECLSEGQLSYLAFVALVELHTHRAVLAFDEPELHLHPALLSRVTWMLEQASNAAPVVVSTHSDHLLDALGDPSKSVVLCDLDQDGATVLRRPDPVRLAEWLQNYRGFGSLRAEGYQSHVMATTEHSAARDP